MSRNVLLAFAGLFAVVAIPTAYIEVATRRHVVPPEAAPAVPWGIVFGAGLAPGGEPSPILAERLETALLLWRTGRVERLLLTGNTDPYHDEIRSMRRYLTKGGVPERAISVDLEGLSTFDSCWRARGVFGVQRAILVTQAFHLPRAVFLARSAGIDAMGVRAGGGRWRAPYVWRELLARPLALVDAWVHPRPPLPAASPLAG
ncbi:MAG TPA: ElyC/SanA/YdcF family protein [Myxococcaceae bacterium]|nr:ElyC/SanA/YdcF family protein [Myxococcaceae bacterium]